MAPLALVSALMASAQADTELRWKFKSGDKTRYEMKMDMTQETKSGPMPFQVKVSQIMDMTWEVTDVAADGSATLSQTIDRVRMEMTLPQAGQPPMKYDSQQESKAPGTETLAKIFDAMIGKPFIMKVSPLGKVSDMQAPDGMVQAFKNMPAGGMFSEDGLKQMIGQSMMPLPEEAVAVGKTWDQSAEMETPPFGKQVTTTQYKFGGEEEVDGKKFDKIDVAMDVKLEPSEDAQAKIKLAGNDASGVIYWDTAAGQPADSRVNSKMKFEITVGTNSLEQTVTTKSSMKRVAAGEAREL
jgi:hypothetical protein